MATIRFEDEEGRARVRRIPGFGFIDCTDDDDFGFSGEMPAQSAGAVSRRRKLLGEVIHLAAPAGAEGEAARGHGGIETAPTSEYVAGAGSNTLILPERGGAWSRVFCTRPPRPATAWKKTEEVM